MGSITAANAIVTLTIPGIFSAPQQLQGFDVDDVYDVESVDVAETKIGVDGVMSSGYIFFMTPWTVALQADSASVLVFETWLATQKAQGLLFPATGTVQLQSTGRKYAMTNGVLQNMKQMPPVKKVLQPRLFKLMWQDISPAPYSP